MIQAIAAGVIWCLVVCLLPGSRYRTDHSILVAAVMMAAVQTLNVKSVYATGDGFFGGRNLLDLGTTILMVIGIRFLSRAIIRAADPGESLRKRHTGDLIALGSVIVALIVSFSFIDAPNTSTAFMVDYGGQLAAAIYSAIQFLYIGVVVTVTGVICFRFRRDMSKKYFRIALAVIGVGCFVGLLDVVTVLGMDVLHLQGRLQSMQLLSRVYDVAQVAAITLLCAGLAIPPVARRWERRAASGSIELLLKQMTAIWDRATAGTPEYRLEIGQVPADPQDADNRRLHRMMVEVQDAMLRDPDLDKLLTDQDVEVMDRVEEHLSAPVIPHDRALAKTQRQEGNTG
ncbi:hypothetical protein [Paenarthrobacter sp. PH39-S1]|uniref:hypothetical protein n=1 Tax=Paenarthrobacter sp. PH39-S1 TaxID=3046204 RepID=UPI0024BBE256|nr:hypothetical protein [Paenarthrobacter sp. PH39-S1]MDJ0356318.1 hypothetical protein [Paenarthrobacter sp. PH39-S1]